MSDSMSLTDTVGLALVMLPIVIIASGAIFLVYRRQSLTLRGAGAADQQQMQGLMDTARRMEQRIGYLENVLDTEAPGWRSRSETR